MKKSILLALLFTASHLTINAQYTRLLSFNFIKGKRPLGSLVTDGTFLYGMTREGGIGTNTWIEGLGVIFKIKPDGTGYSKLLNFTGGADGMFPLGSLISVDSFLYGMTCWGGTSGSANGYGTIFKIKHDGTGYSKLKSFGSLGGNGPTGALISVDSFLYGMAPNHTTNEAGVIFKIKPDGSGYVDIYNFTGSATGSGSPVGSLISDGTFLYGMTYDGGLHSFGTIFKIMPDGSGYVRLHNFGSGTDGDFPNGSLISDGTFLYGMTEYGGSTDTLYPAGNGTIFKIKPDGTGYVKLFDFDESIGHYPKGDLISDGTFLYGMTSSGGTNNHGSLFQIKPDGTGYSRLYDFASSTNGHWPHGSLIYNGGLLYGMTSSGGGNVNSPGTIFKYCSTTVTVTQSPTVCDSIIVGSHTYNVGGTYIDSLTTVLYGCDSTVITHLTVLNSVSASSTQTLSRCFGQSVTVGTATYTTNGTYTYTFSGNSCDSTVTTHLTVLPANTFSQTITKCAGQSIAVGIHTYFNSGNYTDTVISYHGCDSAVITNLIVLPANTFSQTITKCAGESLTVGAHNYTASGNYTDMLTSYQGCDSSVSTHLTINTTSVTVSHSTLTANTAGATYQWINCNGNTPITGQINQSYTATANGSYAVIKTQGNCSDTSACHSITTIGIDENSLADALSIYPNPFTSQTTITFNEEQKNTNIKIIDELGKEVKSLDFTGKQLIIERREMNSGTYFLQVKTRQGTISKKIIIN